MKNGFYQFPFLLVLFIYGCNETKQKETKDRVSIPAIQISTDDSLRKSVERIIQEFPGVDATVIDGVITINGLLDYDRFVSLKQSLDALPAKKVVYDLKYT